MNRSEVYRAIDSERAYQQAQGLPDERTKLEWMQSINHYCNMAWSDTHAKFPEHVRKIAALAVAALEQHDCTPREGFEQPATPDMEPVPDGEYDCAANPASGFVVNGNKLTCIESDNFDFHRGETVILPPGWQLMRPREVSDGD